RRARALAAAAPPLRLRVPVRPAAARAARARERRAARDAPGHAAPRGVRPRRAVARVAGPRGHGAAAPPGDVRWSGAARRGRQGADHRARRRVRRRADRRARPGHGCRRHAGPHRGHARGRCLAGRRHARPGRRRVVPPHGRPARRARRGRRAGGRVVRAVLRLTWHAPWRRADGDGGARLLTLLAVLAFAVTTTFGLSVVGGLRAFERRAANPTSNFMAEQAGAYVVLAWIAVVLLVVPLLSLGGAAARLGVSRRNARLATLRLLGATPREVVGLTVAETA